MKKSYISPNMEVVNIQMTNHLLEGSQVPIGDTTGNQWAPEFEFDEEY